MDIDRGLFLRGWFKSVSRHDDRLQKIGRGHLAWLAMRDEAAHNAVVLADSAREAGFSVEVYPFHASFAVPPPTQLLSLDLGFFYDICHRWYDAFVEWRRDNFVGGWVLDQRC